MQISATSWFILRVDETAIREKYCRKKARIYNNSKPVVKFSRKLCNFEGNVCKHISAEGGKPSIHLCLDSYRNFRQTSEYDHYKKSQTLQSTITSYTIPGKKTSLYEIIIGSNMNY